MTEVVVSEEHWYQSPSNPEVHYPSVTTILSVYPKGEGFKKYLLAQGSEEEADKKLRAAAERGTKVHEATECLHEGAIFRFEDGSFTLEEWHMLNGYAQWYQDYQPEIIAIEQSVVSDSLQTGGTIDRVIEVEGELGILDVKTSKSVYPSYYVQSVAYADIWEEKTGQEVKFVSILRLRTLGSKKYEIKTIYREDFAPYRAAFNSCHQLWHLENQGRSGPVTVEVPEVISLKDTN